MVAIYVMLFAVLGSAIALILPPVIEEIGAIARGFPSFYQQAIGWYSQFVPASGAALSEPLPFSSALSVASQSVVSIAGHIFGGFFALITVIVLTFYLIVDEGSIKRTLSFAPKNYQTLVVNLYERVQVKIGIWLRAQIVLMGLVGLLVYLLLSALRLFGLNMPFALVLAVFAALMEFIPYVGPIIGAIPAVFLAYSLSPALALVVALVYYGIHLIEANVFVPKIMERALGLSPIISILVFIVGAKLAGIAGAFLAVPIATASVVIIKELYARRSARENAEAVS